MCVDLGEGVSEGLEGEGWERHTLEMAPVRVGLGPLFLAPKRRFIFDG